MEVVVCRDADEVGRVAGARIAHLVGQRPDPVLGVATGSSPLATYADLARRVREGSLDLRGATAFALDEYVGLPPEHPQSYAATIRRDFAEPVGLDPDRMHVPDGTAANPDEAGRRYDEAIAAAGGIDVQLLGIGANGHIGFNEPSSSLASRTRMKTLTMATREANARFFESVDEVPTHCLTQGLGTIMEARHVVLVATGEAKAEAVAGCVEGPVSTSCPASVLQFHPKVWVVVDEAAASRLRNRAYYDEVLANRPPSQLIAD